MDALRKGLLPLNSPGEIEIIRFSKSSGIILPAGADPKSLGKKVAAFTTGGILSLKNLKKMLDFYLVRPPSQTVQKIIYFYSTSHKWCLFH